MRLLQEFSSDQSIVAISRFGMSLGEHTECLCNSISPAACVLLLIAQVSFALPTTPIVQCSARRILVGPANTTHMLPHRNRNWFHLRRCVLPFGTVLLVSHRTPPFAAVPPLDSHLWGRLCRRRTHSLVQIRLSHRQLWPSPSFARHYRPWRRTA